jgi:signal transduction histidine kinase
MKVSIRQSLIAVAVLGAVTCVVSTFALSRIIAANNAQRADRARDLVAQELELLRTVHGAEDRRSLVLGLRGGLLPAAASVDTVRPSLDPPVQSLLAEASARSSASGQIEVAQSPTDDAPILVGVAPRPGGGLAWATYAVPPSRLAHAWRIIGITLGVAGLALVVASLHLALSAQRGASALKRALSSLGRNLEAPVPRPALRELADVADGIAGLAAELSEAQKEQSRLSKELAEQQRLAALGRVAAGVAHEVRNPLASIKLRLDLARLGSDAPPALVAELAQASEEIARLDRVVADLLTVAGRKTGPRQPTDLRALAAQRASIIEPWARDRAVRIDVSGAARASVDADAIGRVIDNLVKNAVEASRPDDVVRVRLSDEGGTARVAVADHGAGVDPSRAHELFEPFFTTKQEGTGLGLAISRAIASAHGGNLTYQRKGSATEFELALPAEEARA